MLSKILLKVLINMLLLITIYLSFIFIIFVPNIQNNIMELEENIGEAQLQKIVQIVKSSSLEMSAYAENTLTLHKNELKKLTTTVWNIINMYEKQTYDKNSTKKIQSEVIDLIRNLKYNQNDYFFVSDYNNNLISHPYLQNVDFTNVIDAYGNKIVPPMVELAKKDGEGFTSYWWKKNNNDNSIYEKISYIKNFNKWKWVVGTGIYLDDIDREILLKKEKLLVRLKAIIQDTRIGETGYVYIFNANGKMILHPNKDLEGKLFDKMINPSTNKPIFDDLIKAYKFGDKKLYYLWDNLNDKGNFIYKKISWIEYDPFFDWYICSSGYLDEFYTKSKELRDYMFYATVIVMILISIIGLYFFKQILNPIINLAQNAQSVIDGNLNTRYTGKINNDETGILAKNFNLMIDTIHKQIDTLDLNIQSKTKELSNSLEEKEILLKEVNHRVKNNLNIISSIIGLQSFSNKNIPQDEFIKNIQNRIQSIALAHKILCNTDTHNTINIESYIKLLVDSLLNAYIINQSSYICKYDIHNIKLSLDQVLSCSLIINELITNIIKYALDKKNNLIEISLSICDNLISLSIKDNGPGFNPSKAKGIGIELVEMSIKQLKGTMNIEINKGSKITVIFPQ